MPDLFFSSVGRSDLWENGFDGLFLAALFVCFIQVLSYVRRQARAGSLIQNEASPTPLPMAGWLGWLFVVTVIQLILLKSILDVLLVVAGAFGLALENGRTIPEQFGFNRLPPVRLLSRSILLLGALMFVEIPVSLACTHLFNWLRWSHPEQEVVEIFRSYHDFKSILVFTIEAAFIFPIIEELFFRGLLFPFLKKFTSTWVALVFSAGIFACAHLNLNSLIPLWIFGLILGLAYEHTGSLLLTICVHALWNLCTALSLMAGKGDF